MDQGSWFSKASLYDSKNSQQVVPGSLVNTCPSTNIHIPVHQAVALLQNIHVLKLAVAFLTLEQWLHLTGCTSPRGLEMCKLKYFLAGSNFNASGISQEWYQKSSIGNLLRSEVLPLCTLQTWRVAYTTYIFSNLDPFRVFPFPQSKVKEKWM